MRFPHDVGQDVKAPPVGHPHDDFLNPLVRALLEDRVKGRYKGFSALQREAFLSHVAGMEKILEFLSLHDFAQDAYLLIMREGGAVVRRLDPGLDPAPLLRSLDVKVLDAHVFAIGPLEAFEDLADGHAHPTEVVPGKVDLGKVRGLEPETLQAQARVFLHLGFERIKGGLGMADVSKGIDCSIETGMLLDGGMARIHGRSLRFAEHNAVFAISKVEALEEVLPLGLHL